MTVRTWLGDPHRLKLTLIAAGAPCLAFILLLLLVPRSPAPSSRSDADAATAQDLREIEETRLEALVDAEVDVVEPRLADDFRIVTPDGETLSREESLEVVATGQLDYLAFEPVTDIEVRLYENAAVLWYRSHIEVVAGGQDRLEHEVWHMYVYELHQGHWQVVWEQATGVGGFPPT